jgi:hypothetical protein
VPRGLGDSVHASNLSRKKLGDCDFQSFVDRRCFAYEAHGGALTNDYVEEHFHTLGRVLPFRIADWQSGSHLSEWELIVLFVAHDISQVSDRWRSYNATFKQIRTRVLVRSFSEVRDALRSDGSWTLEMTDAFKRLLIDPLNEIRTPQRARDFVIRCLE